MKHGVSPRRFCTLIESDRSLKARATSESNPIAPRFAGSGCWLRQMDANSFLTIANRHRTVKHRRGLMTFRESTAFDYKTYQERDPPTSNSNSKNNIPQGTTLRDHCLHRCAQFRFEKSTKNRSPLFHYPSSLSPRSRTRMRMRRRRTDSISVLNETGKKERFLPIDSQTMEFFSAGRSVRSRRGGSFAPSFAGNQSFLSNVWKLHKVLMSFQPLPPPAASRSAVQQTNERTSDATDRMNEHTNSLMDLPTHTHKH